MDEVLQRDQNHVTVLAGITNDAFQEIRMFRVDPATGAVLVSGTGGGGGGASLSILSSSGVIDNSNVIFPFTSQPQLVVVNGSVYRETEGWAWDGTNATLDGAVGVGGDVYAITSGVQIYKTTGTIDNSNITFPFAVQPQLVIVNGKMYRQTKGWSWDGTNVVLDAAVGTGGDIYGLSVITPVQLTASTIDNSNVTFVFASQPNLVVPNGLAYRSGYGWTGNVIMDNPVGLGGDIYAL